MEEENESIDDYQITIAEDLDFLKIIKILQKNKFDENLSIKKKYIHSLFTPLLSYIIDYLNHNKEDKETKDCKYNINSYIGKSVLNDIEIVYALLDKKIYDLFFKKKKGNIGKEEINYDLKFNDENFYYVSAKKK